jgi:4-amino-4-deoxy-L-arabinose transferase-like glycosyltransferase
LERKRDPWLLAAIGFALAYAACLLWLTRFGSVLPPDSIDYAEAARSLVRGEGDTINRVIFHTGLFSSIRHPLEVHGLLQPVLLAPLFWIWGPDGALVRVPSIVFAACLALFVFWTTRRLFGTFAASVAAVLTLSRTDLTFAALLGTDDVGHALFSYGALSCFAVGAQSRKRGWFMAAGLLGALSALEKFSGMVLPAVFGAVLLVSPGARRAVGLKNWLWTAVLLVPVALLYVYRNYRVYGTPSSPYGGIEWFGKDRFSAYFALYEKPPTTSEAWSALGIGRVMELITAELVELAQIVASDPMLIGGIVALLWLWRRSTVFALSALFYTGAVVVLVCVLHHVEERYLSGLVPLCATAVGAAAGTGLAWLETRVATARIGALRAAAFAAAGIALLLACARPLGLAWGVGRVAQTAKPQCSDMLGFVRSAVAPSASVLTGDPWLVAWHAERAAVNAPTNGSPALAKVVEHYRIDWAITGPATYGALDLGAALRAPELADELRPELVFDGVLCDVYRLRGRAGD